MIKHLLYAVAFLAQFAFSHGAHAQDAPWSRWCDSTGNCIAGNNGWGVGVFGQSSLNDAVKGWTGSQQHSGVAGFNHAGGIGTYGWSSWGTNGYAGYFDGMVAGTQFVTLSDGRLKDNVQSISVDVERLLKLRPVTFTWRSDKSNVLQTGLIAQEVRAVFPELIRTAKDEVLAVDYQALSPLLLSALQNQERRLRSQEKRLLELERERSVGRASLADYKSSLWALTLLPVAFFARRRLSTR